MSDRWANEPMTKQDLLVTLGVIVAILWVGNPTAVMKTIDGVKQKFAGLLTAPVSEVEK